MRVLVIGCGGQGAMADAPGSGCENKVLTYGKAFSEVGSKMTFVDENPVVAEEASLMWGGISCTMAEALEKEHEVVVVSTPDLTHWAILKQIRKVIARKPKLVVCEKPLCETSVEAKEIASDYLEWDVPILVDYTRRFIPEYIALSAKTIGKDMIGTCVFNRGWTHTASHAVDTFRMLGVKKFKLVESSDTDRNWHLHVEGDGVNWTESRQGNQPVHEMFDMHMRYLVRNVLTYLEGEEPLFCTANDGVMALAIVERYRDRGGAK